MIEKLKEEIIKTVGRTITTPLDFEWLSEKIFKRTSEKLSPTTLKRLFGYLNECVKPRNVTLDILARFVGYKDYNSFTQSNNDINSQSNLIIQESITSNQLAKGAIIKLTWHPNRICVVRHNGIGNFEVIEA